MKVISGGKMFCWKITINSSNHGWKSKHTQMYRKPLLSLGCLSFCGILVYRHGILNRERWSKNICRGSFPAWPCKNASCLHPQKDCFSSQFHAFYHLTPSLPLLSFPLALFPLYHVSSSESVDRQLFKKQLKLPTYKHLFLCLLNLF